MIRIFFIALMLSGTAYTQNETAPVYDLDEIRPQLEQRGREFSAAFQAGDSIALADFYTTDATFGTRRGRDEILSAWGRIIRGSRENGVFQVEYIITNLATDNEFVVEMGKYNYLNEAGETVDTGKYLVVWRQEEGVWMMYKDMGL